MTRFIKASDVGTGGARALAGSYYTSPEVFGAELERIFLDRWLCVGREEQLPQPGDSLVRTVGAECAVVMREPSGVLRAHSSGWSGSRILSLARWEGFLFASFADTPQPFEESHAPLMGRLTRFQMPRLRAARRIDYDVRANWKLLFENYSECYHCPSVHPALVKLSPAESGENDLTAGPFLGGYMALAPGAGSMTQTGRACAIPVADLPDADLKRVYYYTIFPNFLLSLHPDFVMAHTLWPQSPERTLIECEWLFHPEAASHPGFDPDDGVSFWDKTNREDWRICELTQQGVASRAYVPGPLSPRESISAAFDREVVQALRA